MKKGDERTLRMESPESIDQEEHGGVDVTDNMESLGDDYKKLACAGEMLATVARQLEETLNWVTMYKTSIDGALIRLEKHLELIAMAPPKFIKKKKKIHPKRLQDGPPRGKLHLVRCLTSFTGWGIFTQMFIP